MMENLQLTKLSIKDGGRLEFSLFSNRLERTSFVLADMADKAFLLPSFGVKLEPGNLAMDQVGVAAFSSSNSEECFTPSRAKRINLGINSCTSLELF
jgi:hypothetical protein